MAETGPVEKENKFDSIKFVIIAVVLVTVIAVGGGWIIGTQINMDDSISDKDAAIENKKDKADGEGEEKDLFSDSEKDVVELDTILVALHDSDNVWVRLQLAVVSASEADLADPEIKTRIHSDITAFVKTLTLAQMSSPSGFIHLKEDLLDRARLSTNGQVEDLMIMSIIAE